MWVRKQSQTQKQTQTQAYMHMDMRMHGRVPTSRTSRRIQGLARRAACVILLGSFLGLGLAAPMVGVGGSIAPAAAAAAAKETNLTALLFATSNQQIDAYKAAFKAYEAAHPGIHITPTFLGDIFQDKLMAMTAAGIPPDLLWLWGINFRNLAGTGMLLPLDQYVDKDFLSAYYPSAINASRYEGKLLALPGLVGTLAIMENIELFGNNGVVTLTDNETWDTFLTKAKKLTRDTNGDGVTDCYGYIWYSFTVRDWMPWIWRNGGDLFDSSRKRFLLGEQPAVEAINYLADLSNRYKVTPPGAALYGSPWTYFEQQKAAMYPGGPWGLARASKFRFDVANYPARKNQAIPMDVFYMALHVGTKHPREAADVAKWVTHSLEGEGALYTSAYGLPAVQEYAETYFLRTARGWNGRAFLRPMETGEARIMPFVDNWLKVEATLRTAYNPVWQGKDSATNVAAAVRPKIEALL